MKSLSTPACLLLAASTAFAACLLPVRAQAADNVIDAITLARANYKTDRQAFLAETLQLTEQESAAFWPLYRSYRADMEKLGDDLLKLVLEYSDAYPDVPEDRAERLLKEYTTLEEKFAQKRVWYLKRARKALPAAKVLRWAQLENRMDLALRLQLAGAVPIMPVAQP